MRDALCTVTSPCANMTDISLNTFLSSVLDCEMDLVGHAVFVYILWIVEASLNVLGQEDKPDLVFRRNRRVQIKSAEVSVQSTTGSRGVRISGSNAGYTVFRGNVKGTGYPLHSTVSPSLPLAFVTVCYYISTGLYLRLSTGQGQELHA